MVYYNSLSKIEGRTFRKGKKKGVILMYTTKKPPRYKRVELSEEEKRGSFSLICSEGEKNISFEHLPSDLFGKIVCVESENRMVTSNGWLQTELKEPGKVFLTIQYPSRCGVKRKIFMLDPSADWIIPSCPRGRH